MSTVSGLRFSAIAFSDNLNDLPQVVNFAVRLAALVFAFGVINDAKSFSVVMRIGCRGLKIGFAVAQNQYFVGRRKLPAKSGVRGQRVRFVFRIFAGGNDLVKKFGETEFFDFFGNIKRFFCW